MKKQSELKTKFTQWGFTLIELIIVVVIVSILASMAYPAYLSAVTQSRRSSAQAFLMDIAQLEQQYFLDARSYAPDLTTLNTTTPTNISPYFTITITTTAGPPPSFTITAAPKAGTAQASDVTLTINNAGVKTPSNTW